MDGAPRGAGDRGTTVAPAAHRSHPPVTLGSVRRCSDPTRELRLVGGDLPSALDGVVVWVTLSHPGGNGDEGLS
jgi:hypothetical protein